MPLPDGLVGTNANIRAVVQRRSAQGDCRFEPQGYPAQILGSSAFVLAPADATPQDFSDLAPRWANGIEVLLPASAAEQPTQMLGLVAEVLNALSPETAPITVRFDVARRCARRRRRRSSPSAMRRPTAATPRVRFDRGRVVVADRAGRTLLDLGGFPTGAVAQIVTAGEHPGLWIKPLATDGALPAPDELQLDRGDVAFLDGSRRGARDVDRARHAGAHYLSRPGVVADRRRALPLVDHRRACGCSRPSASCSCCSACSAGGRRGDGDE